MNWDVQQTERYESLQPGDVVVDRASGTPMTVEEVHWDHGTEFAVCVWFGGDEVAGWKDPGRGLFFAREVSLVRKSLDAVARIDRRSN